MSIVLYGIALLSLVLELFVCLKATPTSTMAGSSHVSSVMARRNGASPYMMSSRLRPKPARLVTLPTAVGRSIKKQQFDVLIRLKSYLIRFFFFRYNLKWLFCVLP